MRGLATVHTMICVQWVFLLIFVISDSVDCRRRRFRECTDDRLKVRESFADVIVTGTVKRLYGNPSVLYSSEVQVKRVVKGGHIKAGESLLVEGFGNNDICSNKVRRKDSRIFLLNQLYTGSFRLNSSLLQINIPNLERIAAVVNDVPYRRRAPILEEPCEKKYCPHNGDCFDIDGRASCQCPVSCHESYSPICGSDSFTYNTECQMRIDSCRKQKRVYVRHEGACFRS